MAQDAGDPTPASPRPDSIWPGHKFVQTEEGWRIFQDQATYQYTFKHEDTGDSFTVTESELQSRRKASKAKSLNDLLEANRRKIDRIQKERRKVDSQMLTTEQMVRLIDQMKRPEYVSTPKPAFSLDEIKKMTLEEYAAARSKILEQYGPVIAKEKQAMGVKDSNFPTDLVPGVEIEGGDPLLACYWCGHQCKDVDELDDHEPACEEARKA